MTVLGPADAARCLRCSLLAVASARLQVAACTEGRLHDVRAQQHDAGYWPHYGQAECSRTQSDQVDAGCGHDWMVRMPCVRLGCTVVTEWSLDNVVQI